MLTVRNATNATVNRLIAKIEAGELDLDSLVFAGFSSAYPQPSKLQGIGVEDLMHKKYEPGDDDASEIDYGFSATQPPGGELYVQLTRRPRPEQPPVQVIVDVNKSMHLGMTRSKHLLAALCAGCGVQSALRRKHEVSFATFNRRGPISILDNQAPRHMLFEALVHAVEDGQDSDSIARRSRKGAQESEGSGLAHLLDVAGTGKRRLAVIVSDFANMNEADWGELAQCARFNDVRALFVQHYRERELPDPGWFGMQCVIADPVGMVQKLRIVRDRPPSKLRNFSRRVLGPVTTSREYRQNFMRHQKEVEACLDACMVPFVIVSTEAEKDAVASTLAMLTGTI
jgi:hypothetical protein